MKSLPPRPSDNRPHGIHRISSPDAMRWSSPQLPSASEANRVVAEKVIPFVAVENDLRDRLFVQRWLQQSEVFLQIVSGGVRRGV